MKKLILLLQFIVCTLVCNAQVPNWLWGEPEYSDGFGYCSGLAIGPNDTLYMVGREGGTITLGGITQNPGGTYPFLAKLDTNYPANPNNAIFVSTALNSGFDYAYAICSDKENNLYNTGDENSGGSAYVVKLNPVGLQVGFNNTGVGNGQGYGVVVDNSENVYETGNYDGNPTFGSTTLPYGGSQWAGFLTKFDSSLYPIWATYFDATDGSNQNYTTGKSVALDLQANVYVTGSYQGAATFYSANGGASIAAPVMPDGNGGNSGNLFVAKYDSSGVVQWVIAAPNAGMDPNSWGYGNKIKVDSCGNVYVAGYFENTATFGNISVTCTNGSRDMFVAKFNTKSMEWEWVATGLGNGSTYATDIALDKTSDVYVVGGFVAPATFGDSTLSSGSNYIAKFNNSSGALQWVQSANISGQSSGVSGVVVDGDNYCYIDGTYSGSSSMLGSVTLPNAAGGSGFIAKLDTVAPRAIIPKLDSSYCPGSSFYIDYSIIGTFAPGNIFTAQLSELSGSFNTPLNIGDTLTNIGGSVFVTLPDTLTPGSTYLIRVVSSSPATSSYVNGCGSYYSKGVYVNDFYITIGSGSNIPVVLTANPGTTICSGQTDTIEVSGGGTYQWGNPVSSDSVIIVSPALTTTYNVQVTKGSCQKDTSIVITVGTSTPVTITPQSPTTCNGGNVTLNAPVVAGTTYTWSPSASLSSTSGNNVVASPTIETVYTVNGSGSGCPSSGTDTVFIGSAPPLYIYPPSDQAITCAGQGITLTVSDTLGSGYVWGPTANVNPDTGNSIIATPFVTTTFTVSGRDSEGCYVTAYDTVSTKKGINKPVITLNGDVLTSSATQGNQWYEGGNEINGATADSLVVPGAGCYWTSATNIVNGCSSLSDTICVTSINRLTINPSLLSIYPNPTGGEIYINISSSVAEVNNWNLQIRDVLGRTVYTRLSLNYSNDIDLSNLASGVYFITILNNTARAVYPIVKQN